MRILIDGYNLLFAAGLARGVDAPGGLERARTALLNLLASQLGPERAARTTVVFDAGRAPADQPDQTRHRGLTVCYATRHETADDMLVELIRQAGSPRRLVVVSSDRQVQRAARRRRARVVSSEAWWERHRRRGRAAGASGQEAEPGKPAEPLSEAEVQRWVALFEGPETQQSRPRRVVSPPAPPPDARPSEPEKPEDSGQEVINPFPPGYGEDLLEDEP